MTQGQPRDTDAPAKTLRTRLGRLLSEEPAILPDMRRLVCDCTADAMTALLRETSEVHLPRKAIFRNDRGEELALDVSSGRILRLSDPTSDHLLAQFGSQTVEEISTSAKGSGPVFAQLLSVFTDHANELTIETQEMTGRLSTLDIGLAVEDICAALQPTDRIPATDRIAQTLTACKAISSAAVLISADRVILGFGAEAAQASLVELAKAEYAQSEGSAPAAADAPISSVIYAGHPTEGAAILCIACGSDLGLLTFHAQSLDQVLTHVHRLNASPARIC